MVHLVGRARSALLVLLVGIGTSSVSAGDDSPAGAAEGVATAIRRGVQFLSARQAFNGSWGDTTSGGSPSGPEIANPYGHPIGATALALYALLASGVPNDDARVVKGYGWMDRQLKRGMTGFSSYEMSAVLLATTARTGAPLHWRRAGTAKLGADDRRRAQAALDALLAVRAHDGLAGWRYNLPLAPMSEGGNEDLSSTGFAALALFTADRCGLKVPVSLWPELVRFAIAQQDAAGDEHERAVDRATLELAGTPVAGGPSPTKPRGGEAPPRDRARGFAYIKSESLSPDEGTATGGMTACGISIIQISRLLLSGRSAKGWGAVERTSADQSLLDACAWLDANWSASANPMKTRVNKYHVLYASHVAAAMDLVGSARIGTHAWEQELSDHLVTSQSEKGSWDSESAHEPRAVLDTSFALLFFARPFSAPGASAGAK